MQKGKAAQSLRLATLHPHTFGPRVHLRNKPSPAKVSAQRQKLPESLGSRGASLLYRSLSFPKLVRPLDYCKLMVGGKGVTFRGGDVG